MPNWRPSSLPNNVVCQSKFQPRIPMLKPWMISQLKPITPVRINIFAYNGSLLGRLIAKNGMTNGISSGASQSFSPCPIKKTAGA